MELIRKVFEIKGASLDDNCIKGPASVMGVMDRGGDVIFPGFFKNSLPAFRKNGFVAVGHKWDQLPVAMPTMAVEKGNQLYTEAEFHSHQAAQDARSVARERLDKSLNMGLSIGFFMEPTGYKNFRTGKDLLRFAADGGYDMGMFDTEGIGSYKSPCRALIDGDELIEYSIVPAPMNILAGASEVKSLTETPGKTAVVKMDDESAFDNIEPSLTMGAIERLVWRLYSVFYDTVYDYDGEPLADRRATLDTELGNFSTFILKVFDALMTETADPDCPECDEGVEVFSLALKAILEKHTPTFKITDITTVRSAERFLRAEGFSREKAVKAAPGVFKALDLQRDSVSDDAVVETDIINVTLQKSLLESRFQGYLGICGGT